MSDEPTPEAPAEPEPQPEPEQPAEGEEESQEDRDKAAGIYPPGEYPEEGTTGYADKTMAEADAEAQGQ
jgi:hypothetical protein